MNWARRLRWQVAAPVLAALAAMTAAALPAAAQAAGPPRPGAGPNAPAFRGFHGVTAGPAAALQAPVPPVAGATPAVAGNPTVSLIFGYTGSDTHAYVAPLTSSVTATQSLAGSLVGGPGLTFVPADVGPAFTATFGRGPNNALWLFTGGSPAWSSLGGTLTSRPGVGAGALSVSGGEAIDAVVRGPDGAVWDRELTPAGTKPWRSLGGRTMAGSGPAAVNVGGIPRRHYHGRPRHVLHLGTAWPRRNHLRPGP